MSEIKLNNTGSEYQHFVTEVVELVQQHMVVAVKAVQSYTNKLYWKIGELIIKRQKENSWGKSVVEQLSKDLKLRIDDGISWSPRNLWFMRQLVEEYSKVNQLDSELENIKVNQAGSLLENSKVKRPVSLLEKNQQKNQRSMKEEQESDIILYQTDDGKAKIEVRLVNESAWLNRKMMAELFQTTISNINLHLKNIFEEGKLQEDATIKDFLIVQNEGNRKVLPTLMSVAEQYNKFE